MATRSSRLYRDCDPCIKGIYDNISPYLSRLVNNIDFTGAATDNTAPDFIAYTLATEGGIAYIRSTNEWVKFTADSPIKKFGLIPAAVRLWSDERQEWSGSLDITKDGDICIFPANANFYPIVAKVRELVDSLETVETNISQNLNNMRELAVAVTRDNKLTNQLKALNKQRQSGDAVLGILTLTTDTNGADANINALLSREEAQDALTVISLTPQVNNNLAEYLELKKDYREELNNTIGVTEVAEKSERRINSEMEMIENSTYAMIDLILDSVNKYAKFYGVDIHGHRAHSGCAEHVDKAIAEEGTESKISALEGDTDNDTE